MHSNNNSQFYKNRGWSWWDGEGGEVNWVASHPPWVCSVHNTNSLFDSDLLELTILVNKVYDETQINHSDREKPRDILNISQTV